MLQSVRVPALGGAVILASLIAALVAPGTGRADDSAPVCVDEQDIIDAHTYLRALSLDLRGEGPSLEDYARIGPDGSIPEDLIDEWLQSSKFSEQAVRHHKSLYWPNVSDVRIMSNRSRLIPRYGIWYRYLVAELYRGEPIHCGEFEAEFDQDGKLITRPGPDGGIQEGWVWVNPYWDPTNPIKICAFEAQPDLVSPWGTRCDGYDARYDPHCGCGPELAWCDTNRSPPTGDWSPVTDSMAEDLNKRVFHIMENNLSYLELLLGRTAFVNGPLVHFYKYGIRIPAHVQYRDVPMDPAILPDLHFTDMDVWVPIELGEEQAGIFTSPAYLTKFQTNRARTNRFYDAFLCQPFQPPSDGISDVANEDPTLDLAQRPGCKYCHTILEPASAHWGRWTDYGAGYMSPERFPAYNPACQWCAMNGESCSPECRRYYITDPLSSEEEPYVGWLRSFEFLAPGHHANIEQGPRLLVERTLADGRLPHCVAQQTATWLLGREPLDSQEDQWLRDLGVMFADSGYQYKEVVKAIVTSDYYRRVR